MTKTTLPSGYTEVHSDSGKYLGLISPPTYTGACVAFMARATAHSKLGAYTNTTDAADAIKEAHSGS